MLLHIYLPWNFAYYKNHFTLLQSPNKNNNKNMILTKTKQKTGAATGGVL